MPFVVDDDVFEADFREWLSENANLPMPKEELEAFLKARDARSTAQKADLRQGRDFHMIAYTSFCLVVSLHPPPIPIRPTNNTVLNTRYSA